MIPGKIFTCLAEFQGIVSVNDLRLPIRLQELLQAPSCFLRSFCFARIRLDPLGSEVLHHDCISMIVSRFTTFTANFVICCTHITKIFCTKYDSANACSARGPCDFAPQADLAISVFREVSINTVFTQIRTSRRCRLYLKMVNDKNWRVSLCVQELYHPQDSLWILATIPVCRNNTGLTVPVRINSCDVSEVNGFSPCLSIDTFTSHDCWIVIRPWIRVSAYLSIHTFAWHDWWSVIWIINLLWRCHGCWGRRAWGRRGMINFLP